MAGFHHDMDEDPISAARRRAASGNWKTDIVQIIAWIIIMILAYIES